MSILRVSIGSVVRIQEPITGRQCPFSKARCCNWLHKLGAVHGSNNGHYGVLSDRLCSIDILLHAGFFQADNTCLLLT